MKIEIDLNDILGDEYGAETLQDSVHRQVVESLTKTIKEGVGKKIDHEVSRVISEEIRAAVTVQMPRIVEDLLSAEYVAIDRWGSRGSEPTTFRKELVKSINAEMVYSKQEYDSKKNAFSLAVDQVIAARTADFKAEFNKQVDAKFIADAMAFATAKLKERLRL